MTQSGPASSSPSDQPLEVHRSIRVLAGLLGTWRGAGSGHYPTIADFAYNEQITFGHVGKPFLAYSQRTADQSTGAPLHAEAGYLRPGARRDDVELVMAQPSGIVEVHTGTIEPTTDGEPATESSFGLHLISDVVATTLTAKSVLRVERRIEVSGDQLSYDVFMEAVGQPFQHHLAATLNRVS